MTTVIDGMWVLRAIGLWFTASAQDGFQKVGHARGGSGSEDGLYMQERILSGVNVILCHVLCQLCV